MAQPTRWEEKQFHLDDVQGSLEEASVVS
jgi:hypothetical protein